MFLASTLLNPPTSHQTGLSSPSNKLLTCLPWPPSSDTNSNHHSQLFSPLSSQPHTSAPKAKLQAFDHAKVCTICCLLVPTYSITRDHCPHSDLHPLSVQDRAHSTAARINHVRSHTLDCCPLGAEERRHQARRGRARKPQVAGASGPHRRGPWTRQSQHCRELRTSSWDKPPNARGSVQKKSRTIRQHGQVLGDYRGQNSPH
jgi:hypothetical protein